MTLKALVIYSLFHLNVFCSFHARLKTNYLNGKVNRRVDFLLDALLKIESDCFYKSMTNHHLANLNRREIKEVNRHQRGLQINPESVTVSKRLYISMLYLHTRTCNGLLHVCINVAYM